MTRRAQAWRYLGLLGLQTVGAFVLLWEGVPLYRDVLIDPGAHEPGPGTLLWVLPSIALIQVGYWICWRKRPPVPSLRNELLGLLILFAAQMGFVFVSAVFGFVFITQSELSIPVFRYLITLLALFSLFFYEQELERLSRILRERP